VGSTDSLWRRLRQAEVLHFPRRDQVLDRPRDILDRHVRVDAVLVEQVDGLDLQPRQHRVHDVTDVIRTAVEATATRPGLLIDVPAELRSNRHLVAHGCEGVADEHLVGERAVDLRGVEVSDTALDRGSDDPDPFLPIGCRTVDGLAPHAPVSEGRHVETVLAQCALLHDCDAVIRLNRESIQLFLNLVRVPHTAESQIQ